jgi:hypothetical protein
VSTTHSTHENTSPLNGRVPSQADCLRHHVWMAACPDCRDARRARTDDGLRTAS